MPLSPGRKSYTYDQLYDLLGSNGFKGDALDIGAAIVLAESGGADIHDGVVADPKATNTNDDGSIDRGLWQINSKWHPEVSVACAFNPGCATRAAWGISKKGTDFTPWATYNSGAYKTFYKKGGASAASGAKSASPLGNADEPVTEAVDAAGGALQAIASMLGVLFDASTWFRVGKVALGALLLLFIGYQLVR